MKFFAVFASIHAVLSVSFSYASCLDGFPEDVLKTRKIEVLEEINETLLPHENFLIRCMIRGPRGGKQKAVFRKDHSLPWLTPSLLVTENVDRGSPEWPIHVLGVGFSRFLGFEKLSENLILVPDADELNLALDEHQKLHGKDPMASISIRFETVQGLFDSKDYLKLFVEKLKLPVAKTDYESHHDSNIHVAAGLLIPEEAFEMIKLQIQMRLAFVEYMKQKGFDKTSEYVFKLLTDTSYYLESYRLDRFSSYPTFENAEVLLTAKYSRKGYFDGLIEKIIYCGISIWLDQDTLLGLKSDNPYRCKYSEMSQIPSALSYFEDSMFLGTIPQFHMSSSDSYSEFEKILKEFVREKAQLPLFNQGLNWSDQVLLEKTKKREQKLRMLYPSS